MSPARSHKAMGARSATLVIVFSAVCFGLAPWFAKGLSEAGLASSAIALFRFLTSALILLIFLRFSHEKRKATFWAIGSGIAVGLGWIGYVEALKAAPVSTVGVIYMTYPLFTLLIAWLWLKQQLTLRAVGAGMLVLAAAFIALAPAALAPKTPWAALACLTAPLSFGFAICVLASRLRRLSALERAAGFSLGAVLGLLPLILSLEPGAVIPREAGQWMLILGISVVTALLPNLLFSAAAPLLGAGRTSMAGSMELPTMFAIGWLAFNEPIGLSQVLAGALIIAAIVLAPVVSPDDGH